MAHLPPPSHLPESDGAKPDTASRETTQLLRILSDSKAKLLRGRGISSPRHQPPIHCSSSPTQLRHHKQENDPSRALSSGLCFFPPQLLRGVEERRKIAAGFGFQLVNPDANFSMGHF